MQTILSRRLTCALILAALATASSAWADEPAKAPGTLALSTERVVVYKDGYALIIKNATATADANGHVSTQQVPDAAVLGCFWALADQKVLGMKAEFDEVKSIRQKTNTCLNVRDLLRANQGKKVTVILDDGKDKRTISGTVSQVLEEKVDAKEPLLRPLAVTSGHPLTLELPTDRSPFDELREAGNVFPASRTELTVVRDLTPRGGEFAVIEGPDAGGKTVLPLNRIVSVNGPELATTTTHDEEITTRTKRLVIDMGKENAGKPVSLKLLYFTPGVRWIPTYRISGELKDKAEIALQGEVVNDLEDFSGAGVDLVVGVPNFRFKDTVSPLSLEQTMRGTMANIGAGNNSFNHYLNNGQMLGAQFDNNRDLGFAAAPPAGPAALTAGEQDLFVYPLTDISLKRGARAAVPLWQQTADLRHLYTYDVKARRSRSTGGMIKYDQQSGERASPLQLTLNTIWHQLELTNGGKMPWTTGAALMMKGNLPLGQDMLTYTPPTSTACVPVTVAVDLRGTTDEEEVERTNAALKVDGYEYALVKKKGSITVNSFRSEKSLMRITLSTGGKVSAASDDGKVKINDFRPDDWDDSNYMRPNNHSDVTWEFTLEPGKSKTLTYTLSSYVR